MLVLMVIEVGHFQEVLCIGELDGGVLGLFRHFSVKFYGTLVVGKTVRGAAIFGRWMGLDRG